MRHCLWREPDLEDKKPALIKWKTVCRQKKKNQGGLGVMNIDVQNKALLLKNLHKLFNKQNIPWVNLIWDTYYSNNQLPGVRLQGSFCWEAHLKLLGYYKAMARCRLGNENSAMFWHDIWKDSWLHHTFSHIYSFSRNIDITIRQAVQNEFLEDRFHLPLRREAYQEFLQLE